MNLTQKIPLHKRLQWRAWREAASLLHSIHSVWSIPTGIGISLTDRCNISCVYCMRQSFKPKPGLMTLSKVKWILKRMPYISGVCIMGLCEPFMNPEAPSIVKWMKEEGYGISLTTNGTIPLTGDRLECLRYLDDFVISIDTHDAETFKYLRGGADLETVMLNLKRVVDFKRKLHLSKTDRPPMHINAVITELNLHHIPNLIRMLDPYVDELNYLMVDPVSRPDYSTFTPLAVVRNAQFQEAIEDTRKAVMGSLLQICGLDYMLEESNNWINCPISWLDIWVHANGDIYTCYDYDYHVGNVFTDNPLAAFNNAKSRSFRKKLTSSDPPLEQCHSCNFARPGWQINGVYTLGHKDVKY